jgi:hypothetical protein
MQGKSCHKTLNPHCHEGSDVKALDQILAQQVHRKSQKNNVKNSCQAEAVAAAAAMLALFNIGRSHYW